MDLRPSYIFDSMMSTGINKIARGRLVLVGVSAERNTGAFIVDKDTSGLSDTTTLQQAYDQKYIAMINKKTDEDLGSFQFDYVSTSNPAISGSMKIPSTWYNSATGQIFIAQLINGSPGWKGNKGTIISKEAMPMKMGFVNERFTNPFKDGQQGISYNVDLKDFVICNTEWWELGDNTKLKNGNSLILPKGLVKVGDMWVACRYPYPFPKSGVLEEEQIAAERKRIGGSYPCRKIIGISSIIDVLAGNTKTPQVDYLLTFTFGSYGYQDKEYVGVEPTPTKSDEPPTGANANVKSIDVVGLAFKAYNPTGDYKSYQFIENVSFSAIKGAYKGYSCFLAPCYNLGLSKEGVNWFKKHAGKVIVCDAPNTTRKISPLEYWQDFIY